MVKRGIACPINADLGDQQPPDWMVRVKEDYFKGGDAFFKSPERIELLDRMDANGIERAIMTSKLGLADYRARRYAERAPERLSVAFGETRKPVFTGRFTKG